MGHGFSEYKQIATSLNTPSFAIRAYYSIRDHIGGKILEKSEEKRPLVLHSIRSYHESVGRMPDENAILDIDVSFDGSWMKRGHTSHCGVGAVIEANTGFVVDFYVVSNHCHKCSRWRRVGKG